MGYEDWSFRKAEVRPGEHHELSQAWGPASVPRFTTLYRFLQRPEEQTMDRTVNATGLLQEAVSTFFVRRMHHHGQQPLPCGTG